MLSFLEQSMETKPQVEVSLSILWPIDLELWQIWAIKWTTLHTIARLDLKKHPYTIAIASLMPPAYHHIGSIKNILSPLKHHRRTQTYSEHEKQQKK